MERNIILLVSMKYKHKHKHKQKTSLFSNVFVFVSIFLISYFFISIFFWVIQKTTLGGGVGIYKSLVDYSNHHDNELIQDVFGSIFSQAKRCSEMTELENKTQCIEDIKTNLAIVLKEEELAGDDGYMWPNDLFFVKQINNSFYRLGWDGVLRDISSEMKTLPSSVPSQDIWNIFSRSRCNYFRSEPVDTLDACEIYMRVSLPEGNYGYMVRIDPQEEEDDFLFTLLLPVISWPLLFMSGFRLSLFMYGIIPLTQLLGSTFLALYILKLLNQNGNLKNGKK